MLECICAVAKVRRLDAQVALKRSDVSVVGEMRLPFVLGDFPTCRCIVN
jgi:hypothetical protein